MDAWLIGQYHWMQAHSVTYVQVVVLVVLLFVAWWWVYNRKQPSVRREPQMGKKNGFFGLSAREVQEHRDMIADAYFSALLDLYADRKITMEQYKYWIHRSGSDLNLPGLLPKVRMTHPKAVLAQGRRLKAEILERIGPDKAKAILDKVRTKPKKGNGKLNIPTQA